MKKTLKSILIIFLALCVAVGAFAIWQRKNIKGIIIGVKESSEEIEKRRSDNQSKLVADIEAVLQSPVREMTEDEKKQTNDKAGARAGTISHFTSTVRNLQAQCDANVEEVIQSLISELSAIGENTDITRTIRQTYENEKQLKLACYANKYLK